MILGQDSSELSQLKMAVAALAENIQIMAQAINQAHFILEYIIEKLEEQGTIDQEDLKEFLKQKQEEFKKQIEEAIKKPNILVAEARPTIGKLKKSRKEE